MRRAILALTCVFIVAAVPGCTRRAASPATAWVTGTIRQNGGAYAVGSRLELEIRDVSGPEEGVVAQAVGGIAPGWEVAGMHDAVDFRVPYDPTSIAPSHTYALSGRITYEGRTVGLIRPVAVLTNGAADSGLTLFATGSGESSGSVPAKGDPWLDAGPPTTGIATPAGATPPTTPSAR